MVSVDYIAFFPRPVSVEGALFPWGLVVINGGSAMPIRIAALLFSRGIHELIAPSTI
jgi:hypothetical protein